MLTRMGAQRAALRQRIGPRFAEAFEFVVFAALALPWIFAGLRPGAVPFYGLAAILAFVLGWLLLALRGGDDEKARRTRDRGLLALCVAVILAGSIACIATLLPRKAAPIDWTPPPSTLETQFETPASSQK